LAETGAVTWTPGRFSKLRDLRSSYRHKRVDGKKLENNNAPPFRNIFYLGFGVNLNSRGVKSRELGNKVVLALTLFLLKLEGDTTNGTARDTLHQVSGETSNLVAKTLGGNDGNLVADLLVGLEIESKTGVVLLDKDT
jgi:hypothetical protein